MASKAPAEARAQDAGLAKASGPSRAARLNWRGGLPLLVEGESSAFDRPPLPVFTFASRQAHLAQAVGAAVAELSRLALVPAPLRTVWLSCQGVPLRWELPVGALFDTLCSQQALPFRIQLNFSAPDGAHLVPFPNPDQLKKAFFHWFKQGMFLRFRSREPFTKLGPAEDEQMRDSVAAGSIDGYWPLLERMSVLPPRAVPVRILYLGQFTEAPGGLERQTVCRQTSVPVDNGAQSVSELLSRELPGLADIQPAPQVLCQGLVVPLDTPIVQLFEPLAHPDLFLYLCVYSGAPLAGVPVSVQPLDPPPDQGTTELKVYDDAEPRSAVDN